MTIGVQPKNTGDFIPRFVICPLPSLHVSFTARNGHFLPGAM
jgi:hypothetical protein